VWLVDTTDEGPLVVRLMADPRRVEMEVALIARCRRAGIPVAEVLWSSDGPEPAMVQRRSAGTRLADVDPPPALLHDVVAVLRSIHTVPLPGGFGSLRSDLSGTTTRLSEWFSGRVALEVSAIPEADADRALLDRAVVTLERSETLLDDQETGLAHGDFQPENILVSGGKVTAVLDWEAAKAGPPALDFGWWDWWQTGFGTPWGTEALLDAYGVEDRDAVDALRELVVVRVWSRELTAAIRSGDVHRRTRSRRGLLDALAR
jgi:aminoglycoside phosphotransferase (APT) family kinase protein